VVTSTTVATDVDVEAKGIVEVGLVVAKKASVEGSGETVTVVKITTVELEKTVDVERIFEDDSELNTVKAPSLAEVLDSALEVCDSVWDEVSQLLLEELADVAVACTVNVVEDWMVAVDVSEQLLVELGRKLCAVDEVEGKGEVSMLLLAGLERVVMSCVVDELKTGVDVPLQLSFELGRVAVPCTEDLLEGVA
jgi:hypothetical protein